MGITKETLIQHFQSRYLNTKKDETFDYKIKNEKLRRKQNFR